MSWMFDVCFRQKSCARLNSVSAVKRTVCDLALAPYTRYIPCHPCDGQECLYLNMLVGNLSSLNTLVLCVELGVDW